MTGLLYKEFLQNKQQLFWLGLTAALMACMPIMMVFSPESKDSFGSALSGLSTIGYFCIVFYIANAFQINYISSDESKRWSSFVISSPKLGTGLVYTKYVFIFLMTMLVLIWCFFFQQIIATITGTATSVYLVIYLLFFGNLLLSAIELPFIFRFGSALGEKIKAGIFIGVIFLVIVYLLFGDLSIFGSADEFYAKCFQFIEQIRNGELPDGIYLFLGLFPIVSFGAYIGSYFLSCKWYLKGVAHYEK